MKNKRNIYKLAAGIVLLVIIYFLFKYSKILIKADLKRINFYSIKRLLLSYGKWSVIIYILIYSIRPIILVIPASLLSVVSGVLYGPVLGTIYTMIGAFFSATIAFYLAKFFGKDLVERLLKGKVAKLDKNIEENGFKIMFLMRLAVVFPYDPLSYAAGLSRMRYSDFIKGTMLGILPEMIAYNYLGTNIHHPFSPKTIIAFLVILMFAIISLKFKPKNEKN